MTIFDQFRRENSNMSTFFTPKMSQFWDKIENWQFFKFQEFVVFRPKMYLWHTVQCIFEVLGHFEQLLLCSLWLPTGMEWIMILHLEKFELWALVLYLRTPFREGLGRLLGNSLHHMAHHPWLDVETESNCLICIKVGNLFKITSVSIIDMHSECI